MKLIKELKKCVICNETKPKKEFYVMPHFDLVESDECEKCYKQNEIKKFQEMNDFVEINEAIDFLTNRNKTWYD